MPRPPRPVEAAPRCAEGAISTMLSCRRVGNLLPAEPRSAVVFFEIVTVLLVAGALLAALARRIGAPYPAFLALAGTALALVPSAPTLSLEPDLVLTLFVAPVLLDAAYDASPRDLRKYWRPIAGGAIVAVCLTVAAVALVARWLVPDMSWPVAIALGAIVAPPDAVAATTVLRALRPPHRVLVVLEGESLLNDATALLIYRVAVAAALGSWAGWSAAPGLIAAILGGVALGAGLGWLFPRLLARLRDVPTSVILQFFGVFAVWIVADRLGLSPVVTLVSFAIAVARVAPERMPARDRIQSYAVWEVAVFVLNVLAFIMAGLQLRPIVATLPESGWQAPLLFAGAILAAVIVVRFAWFLAYIAVARWHYRRHRARARALIPPPTFRGGVVAAWCGMRGVVTLATALALPEGDGGEFPFRSLILLCAFTVVVGTLVLQGLTLRPLLQALRLRDDDPVEREVRLARRRTAQAALAALANYHGPYTDALRAEYDARLTGRAERGSSKRVESGASSVEPRRRALAAERRELLDLRRRDEIGDDAFHTIEEELDWGDMYVEGRLGRG
jgi:Na+/H+ antiporter